MKKKIKREGDGLIYSTESSFEFDGPEDETDTPEPGQQKLNIRLETRHRAGKKATIIRGFTGRKEDLEKLAKSLKNYCGTGGSVVEGEILIQGDVTGKVKDFLRSAGYKTNNI